MNSHTFTTEIFVWLLNTTLDPVGDFIPVLLLGPLNRGGNSDLKRLNNFADYMTTSKRQSQDSN